MTKAGIEVNWTNHLRSVAPLDNSQPIETHDPAPRSSWLVCFLAKRLSSPLYSPALEKKPGTNRNLVAALIARQERSDKNVGKDAPLSCTLGSGYPGVIWALKSPCQAARDVLLSFTMAHPRSGTKQAHPGASTIVN